mmetsp:Transcript_22219/g.31267  ORF Transcript_22219/g.31267 Transcript_22219/m.31267 type:complete len:130 (-) Transcript_22219:2070-2459(-)
MISSNNDVIDQKTIIKTLKLSCLLEPQITFAIVIKLGPAPLETFIIRFAAVIAAPRVSGGLTFKRHGRTLTLGKFAMHPPENANKTETKVLLLKSRSSNPRKGNIPKNVVSAMNKGKRMRLILRHKVPR